MSTQNAPRDVETGAPARPLFRGEASIEVSADPARVYAMVSDLPGSWRWSPECRGGEWVVGEPAALGSVFRGENHRAPDVVAWAPVVRGRWHTTAEVVRADPGRHFAWAMLTKDGRVQESVWSYRLEPIASGGTLLTHSFEMGAPTEGIRGIVADLDAQETDDFFLEWGAKVDTDLDATVRRIREVIEADVAAAIAAHRQEVA